jgi:hypothetical protein
MDIVFALLSLLFENATAAFSSSSLRDRDCSRFFSHAFGATASGVSGEKQETSFSHQSLVDSLARTVRGEIQKPGLVGDFLLEKVFERLSSGESRYVHHPCDWGLFDSVFTLSRLGFFSWGLSSSKMVSVES